MSDQDHMPLMGIDHVEYYVGNARQAAYYYTKVMGFRVTAYSGPETKQRDHTSFVLEQGDARFVLTGAMGPESFIAQHVKQHSDGVRDVALRVPDATHAYEQALARGAESVAEPTVLEDDFGKVVRASIKAYGDTLHSFIERENYSGVFLPGYRPEDPIPDDLPPVGINAIDHIVANVELGKMDEFVEYYARILGFSQLMHFRDDQISSEYTALMSKVMWDGEGRIKFPINEPAPGKKKSQIEEYLDFYGTPGVQHIALRTDDIVAAVRALRARGLRFMEVPATYYVEARERMAGIDLPWDALEELSILVDRDHGGHLLQIFTETVTDRPTVFFEIIEREGATGFGEGNFKALFEAIERQQARRGNL
jgi:4-hydroxyphenylpyruvate dioxygenase